MKNRLSANATGALLATLMVWGPVTSEFPVAAKAPVAAESFVAPQSTVISESPVADAAMRGDVDQVRALLRDEADVDAAQGDGMTALHWAAERGDAGLARIVLAAGATVDPVTRLGAYTPLHIASKDGAHEVVSVLLGAGADFRARTSAGGVAPLHYAAASGSVETVLALVEHGADLDVREHMWQQSPLMYAAAAGRTEVVRVLVDAGADPSLTARVLDMDAREQEDREDQRRREEAAEGGSAGPDERAPGRSESTGTAERPDRPTQAEINDQQRDRVPSSRYSHAQLVGGYGGLAALHLAVRDGRTATVAALLDAGADIDQPSAGDHTTPLLMATINGHFDLAIMLLERGADPNIASDANATPLYTTINTQWIPKSRHPQPAHYMQQQVTYLELMKTLLDAGVDPNVRLTKQLWFTTYGDDYLRVDRMGATPFWRAAYALDLDAMKLLMEYGADPTIPTMKTAGGGGFGRPSREPEEDPSGLPPVPPGGPGVYPIHAASGVGYGEGYAANIHRVVPDGWMPAIRYLVEELGADIDARDHNGYTALHHAAARGDNEMIMYLVERGADPTVVARNGRTTVDMANGPVQRISPFLSTIALLESLGAVNNHNCVSC